jgi:hypothetical protein
MHPKFETKNRVPGTEQQTDKPVELQLARETIRDLQSTELEFVQGGNSRWVTLAALH